MSLGEARRLPTGYLIQKKALGFEAEAGVIGLKHPAKNKAKKVVRARPAHALSPLRFMEGAVDVRRPADAERNITRYKLASWELRYLWLRQRWPKNDRPHLKLLYEKCATYVAEIVDILGTDLLSLEDGAVAYHRAPEEHCKELGNKTFDLLGWIDEESAGPFTAKQEEDQRNLMWMHGVPPGNIEMAIKYLKRRHSGAPAKNRLAAISAADEKLKTPEASWAQIARRIGHSKPNSLQKAIYGPNGLLELFSRHAIPPPIA